MAAIAVTAGLNYVQRWEGVVGGYNALGVGGGRVVGTTTQVWRPSLVLAMLPTWGSGGCSMRPSWSPRRSQTWNPGQSGMHPRRMLVGPEKPKSELKAVELFG